MKSLAQQPSGLTRGLHFLIAGNWSPEQAIDVIELIDDLRDRIATCYQIPLNELMRQKRAPPGNSHPNDTDDPF